MSLKMRGDYILVKPIEATITSSGGIVLTSNTVTPPNEGEIVSIGEGKVLSTGEVLDHGLKVGDRIIYGSSSMNRPLEEDGVSYFVMQVDEVFGKRV